MKIINICIKTELKDIFFLKEKRRKLVMRKRFLFIDLQKRTVAKTVTCSCAIYNLKENEFRPKTL